MSKEQFGLCKFCDKPIAEGTRAHVTADGAYLCEEHAPYLSDLIRQREEMLGRIPFNSGELCYGSREEMKHDLALLRQDFQRDGDRKITEEIN